MRRVPIRMKLAAALAVPLLALVAVTVLEVVQAAQDAQRVHDQTSLAEASIGPVSILSRLEDERNAAAVYLLGQEEAFALPVEDNAEARAMTDDAITAFREEVERLGGDVQEAYGPALDEMEALAALREEVDAAPQGSRTLANIEIVSTNFDGYSAAMEPLFEANKRVALAIDDPDLRRGAELVDLSSRQTNILAILVRDLLLAQVGGTAPDGVNTPGELAAVSAQLGELRANEQRIATKATGRYRELADALFAEEAVATFPGVVDEALNTGTANLDDVIAYSAGDDPEAFGYTVFRGGVTATLSDKADDLVAAAEARQRWFVLLALLSVTVAGTVTWLVSRSITKPLRALTRQASDMAENRLPRAVLAILDTPLGDDVRMPSIDPIDVRTRDEVADVSDALNTVQDTALNLAVEQAVLRRNIADSFVNLGRRNQNLLGRQLDFITELEAHESNPDTLANLFRLDHLATRMRRNAESLLVLAGIEPPRQWAAPVRLTDVIRAALGEVEDYQRVTVRGVEPATIIGSAAADLAHLLAELLENALVFSPPDQTVDIRGRQTPTGGYTLAVIDSGLGMPPDDITAANRRLAGAESFTIAPSKYLGHYVAGNLAARHDIHVRLDNSPGNGITATIDIPATLLTTDTAVAAPVTPPHGTRAVAAPLPAAADTAAWLPSGAPAAATDAASVFEPTGLPTGVPTGLDGRRTESGLVKRPSRTAASTTTGAQPTAELLDSLSRHTARLHGREPAGRPDGTARAPVPAAHAAPPPAPDTRRRSSSRSPVEPTSWASPGDPVPPSWPAPADASPASWPSATPDLPSVPEPPAPTWSPSAPPDGWTPGPAVGPPAAPPPAARRGADRRGPTPDGDTTTGGLARRVRGAQLPTTEPVRMRRPPEPYAVPTATATATTASTPPPRTDAQQRHADDVYTFLSSFTAGVQRGLDEAGRHRPDAAGWG